ncbi:FAD-binding and (Fe-S)-binding domain-containing protein [Halobaculum rubrum]|uniref:FAD-binding and (Fe-S)-binding domain-containing protein n=1 Tax=Halobaculum rubrum TaxID=2872158 RepID=UPI001CA43881|nr:FAD-binding and (Fe-S)-binding domain-containing protein [Halobaculum rubrum]QZX98930.1 FAD-binding protein [Halobaculum rubrum]
MSSDLPSPPDGGPDLTDADYDYGSEDVARPGLVADLEGLVAGDVRFDTYSRQLYATDASAYQRTPIGVVLPRSTDDVAAVMEYCAEREIPVLPRGGGTSLAGQTVNEAVVIDFTRYMDEIRDLDSDAREATVDAGCIVEELNEAAAPHGLKFAPDPAWRDKSAIGGAIGNNSTGSHSLRYGKTDAYVDSCEVVLADGSIETFGEIAVSTMREEADADGELLERIYAELVRIIDEESEAVTERYPDMKRNVSGYNLDVLVEEARGEWAGDAPETGGGTGEPGTVNLARLMCGSEGTLGIVTEATVSLVEVPETKAIALLTYDSLLDAMADVARILEHDPAAVEVMDDTFLDLARETAEFGDVVGLLPEGTDSTLLVEFYAESDAEGRQNVADLVADRCPGTDTEAVAAADGVDAGDEVYATGALEAHDPERRATFWKMRKAGMPILLSRTSDAKHISFIEDCAVPPEHLPEYAADFQALLEEVGTFASFYAHAGPGVLHIRPLVDTKTVDGIDQFERIADGASDLVVKYGGSVSGEHGDGRARTQWNRKLYGDDLWSTFRDLKTAFDPDWLLNPGNVCGDHSLTEHLRFDPEYAFDAGFDPELNWDNENGFQGMAELCHGCGGCRGGQSTTGGVMCPTFRAADEEIQSTRGRANLLRGAMSGDLPADPFSEEFTSEVMDLCVGCKGCKRNCPSGVDMAKLKAEVVHERHEREGPSLRDRLFANVNLVSRVGSALAPLSNLATRLPGSGFLGEKLLGIAAERDLPRFHRTTLRDWFESRGGPAVAEADAERVAVLVPDTYTNYNHPEAGKAAVRVLEAAGVRVELADVEDTGRPAHSMGFLDAARERTAAAVADLTPRVENGRDVVVVEPSEAVMLQSDLLDLHDSEDAATVAANSYGVLEYVDAFRLDEGMDLGGSGSLTYHGHCHQKATKKDHHAVGVLRRAGYEVDPLDSTCCGMAGSFGYEVEHHSMSESIASILFDQVDDSPGEEVTAPGASCRTQLAERDGADGDPPHPVEKVAAALR